MPVREDLVSSAVSFLQDPSVASAPLDKRIAFLQSKNLTPAEVEASLARASGEDAAVVAAATAANASSYQYRQATPPPGYGQPFPGYWPPQPPPTVPRRDWRDLFIMATVLGGVSYGLYLTAKRYIVPLIAPPTPPQLESDKKQIDESFGRAFALLDQLSTDTTTLKDAEEKRTERLDVALTDLEEAIKVMKEADRRRDDDARRNADEIRGLKDLIPKALDANKESQEQRLRELGAELKSLKTLMGNRVGAGARPGESAMGAGALRAQTPGLYSALQQQPLAGNVTAINGGFQSPAPAVPAPEAQNTASSSAPSMVPIASASDVSRTSSPYGRLTNGKAAIPAWQMAAQKKTEEESMKPDTPQSGTVTEATVGA